MMAAVSTLPANENSYGFEVKWDGMRAIAHCEPGGFWLQTRTLRDITDGFPDRRLRPLVRKTSPLADASLPRGAVFVRPQLVGEFSFAEWTQGRLRQPSFLGLREDKPAADVVRERVSR